MHNHHQTNYVFAIKLFAIIFVALVAVHSPQTSNATVIEILRVKANTANLRDGPSKEARIVGKLERGDTVIVTSTVDGWAKIEQSNAIAFVLLTKKEAYVHNSLLTKEFVRRSSSEPNNDLKLQEEQAQIRAQKDIRIDRINSIALRQATSTIPAIQATERLKSVGTNCEHSDWGTILKSIESLEVLADEIWRWAETDPGAADTYLRSHNLTANFAVERTFAVADLALTHGCLDRADLMYRHLIKRYTGSSFAAFRDRARIGIDDVRAKKGG